MRLRALTKGHLSQAAGIASFINTAIANGTKPSRLQLPALATRFGMNKKILKAAFHQEIGMSVGAYVTTRRAEYLKELIGSGKQVKVIALELGYKKPCTFSSEFIRLVGVGPREYQKSLPKTA